MLLAATTSAKLKCPAKDAVLPCTCRSERSGLVLDCNSLDLDDSQLSQVLNDFLSHEESPLTKLSASNNRLTQVPAKIADSLSLSTIVLENNNITSISPGVFDFPDGKTNVRIYLSGNQIESIPSGAFNFPKAKIIHLDLNKNPISTVASDAFTSECSKFANNFFNFKISRIICMS